LPVLREREGEEPISWYYRSEAIKLYPFLPKSFFNYAKLKVIGV
jgi:hypothetical protein